MTESYFPMSLLRKFKDHSAYGGVVPEIASRKHIEAISPVIRQAMADAGLTLKNLEGIAVTRGPGLIGSLLVGLSAAKALAYGLKIPFVGVNHLEGHIMASFLAEKKPQFPFCRPGRFRRSHQCLSGKQLP